MDYSSPEKICQEGLKRGKCGHREGKPACAEKEENAVSAAAHREEKRKRTDYAG